MRSPPSITFVTPAQSRTEDDAVVDWTVTVTLHTLELGDAIPDIPEVSAEFRIDEEMRAQLFDMKMTPHVSNRLSLPGNTIEFKTRQGEDVMLAVVLPRSAYCPEASHMQVEETPACELFVRGRGGHLTVSPADHQVLRRLILSAYRLYARHYEVEAQHPSWWPSGYCAADALDGRIVDCVLRDD